MTTLDLWGCPLTAEADEAALIGQASVDYVTMAPKIDRHFVSLGRGGPYARAVLAQFLTQAHRPDLTESAMERHRAGQGRSRRSHRAGAATRRRLLGLGPGRSGNGDPHLRLDTGRSPDRWAGAAGPVSAVVQRRKGDRDARRRRRGPAPLDRRPAVDLLPRRDGVVRPRGSSAGTPKRNGSGGGVSSRTKSTCWPSTRCPTCWRWKPGGRGSGLVGRSRPGSGGGRWLRRASVVASGVAAVGSRPHRRGTRSV